MGGVPARNLAIPAGGWQSRSEANGERWPNHRQVGRPASCCSLFLTYRNAGDPDPPFRNFYGIPLPGLRPGVEFHGNHSDGVTGIAEDQCSRLMGVLRDGGCVMEVAALERDMRQADELGAAGPAWMEPASRKRSAPRPFSGPA
jgi:hypothetical protein